MRAIPDPPVPSSAQSTSPPVFLRDFAYPHSETVVLTERMLMRMAPRRINATSARTFADLLSGPTVDIYVGAQRKHWSIHTNLLCHHSSYFEAEYQGHEVPRAKKESRDNILELPDDDPRGFELLVKWLYQGQLDDVSSASDEDKYNYAVACHKLSLLASKFSMQPLADISMDAYRRNLHEAHLVPDADEIDEIYRASPRGSAFRRLMTKIAARQIMDPEVEKDAEAYRACFKNNPDFAVDMVNAIRYMSGGMLFDDPTAGDECAWHDHSDDGGCHMPGKEKAHVNGIAAHKARPSALKAQRPSLVHELSAEKRTPRKLNVEFEHHPTPKTNGTPMRSAPRAASVSTASVSDQSGSAPSSPTLAAKRPRRRPSNPPGAPANSPATNGVLPHHPASPAAKKSVQPSISAARRVQSGPPNMNGFSSPTKSDSNSSQPRRLSHVNGIVKQLNGNAGAESDAMSNGTGAAGNDVGRKQPPKLKRKAPG